MNGESEAFLKIQKKNFLRGVGLRGGSVGRGEGGRRVRVNVSEEVKLL